ncbi:MAG: hypothetical protein WBV73_16465 [Phormidium sp.]
MSYKGRIWVRFGSRQTTATRNFEALAHNIAKRTEVNIPLIKCIYQEREAFTQGTLKESRKFFKFYPAKYLEETNVAAASSNPIDISVETL